MYIQCIYPLTIGPNILFLTSKFGGACSNPIYNFSCRTGTLKFTTTVLIFSHSVVIEYYMSHMLFFGVPKTWMLHFSAHNCISD